MSSNLILGEGILIQNSVNGSTTLTLFSDIVTPEKHGNSGPTGASFQYSNIIISPEILSSNKEYNEYNELIGPTGFTFPVENPPFITGITLVNPSNKNTKISIASESSEINDNSEELTKASGNDKAFSFVGSDINVVNYKDGKTIIELIEPDPDKLPSFRESKFPVSSVCGPCNPCPPVPPTPFGSTVFSTIQLGNPSQGTQVTLSTDGINLYLQPSGGNLYTGWTGTIIGSGGSSGTGPTGPTGTFLIQVCPPPFEFGEVYTTAANIYIPIIYPFQEYVGDFPQALPTIESMILDMSYTNTSNNNVTVQILDSGDVPFDRNYVFGLSSSARSKPYDNRPLEGVILNNSSGDPKTNPVKPIPNYNTFYDKDGNISSVWSIVYYVNDLSMDAPGNSMTGTYTNFSDCIVPDTITFGPFLPGTPPSNDAYYVPPVGLYNPVSDSAIQLGIVPPSIVDTGGNPGVVMKRYTSTYYTTGSTIRYGGPIPQATAGSPLSQVINHNPSGASPYPNPPYPNNTKFTTSTALYPDSSYNFNLTATNSLNGTSALCYGPGGGAGLTLPDYSTSNLPLLIYSTPGPASLDISDYSSAVAFFLTPFVGNAWLVSNQTQVTNLFNKTAIVTNPFGAFSVNYDPSTRGLLGSGKTLMNMYTDTSTSSTVNYTTNQNFQSFPLASGASSGSTLAMTSSSVTDQYAAYPTYDRGFYSKVTINNITLLIDSYIASNILRTFNARQIYYQANGSTVAATYSTAQNFYYDQVVGVPNSVVCNASLNPGTIFVSGVSIFGTTPSFTVNTSASNMGDYFYPSPILTYIFSGAATGSVNETNISNVTSTITGGAFVNPVTFNNTNVTPPSNPGTFSSSISLNVIARNIVGASTSTPATISQQGIYDYPSYQLLYSPGGIIGTTKAPVTIQDLLLLNGSYPVVSGCRVWSAPMSTPVVLQPRNTLNALPPPYGFTHSSTLYSYSRFIYDQRWNITSTTAPITVPFSGTLDVDEELQIFNGAYQSVGSVPQTDGYLDYNSYVGNLGVNYSTVSTGNTALRYATFVWRFENNVAPRSSSSTFTFTFKNFQYNNGTATLGIDLNTGCRYISNGGNTERFLFHYRVEEYDNTQIYINPDSADSTRITTLWIDGNSSYGSRNVGGAAVLSSNITDPQNIDGGNYATPSDNTIVRNPSSTVYNIVGNDLIIKVDNIIFIQSNDNKCYVYGRIGLPMTANYSFEYVTCQLTT